jgi:outer membrane protein assembly factor BamB
MRRKLLWALIVAVAAWADDWPEFRGKGRLGVWTETGILEKFPEKGLQVRWRTPIKAGFSGPAVAGGRVFVLDFSPTVGFKGTERAVCLDEKAGKVLWTREWEADYGALARQYAIGPRATPTVDGDRVYTLGAKGALHCFRVSDGEVLWKKNFEKDYGTHVPTWGMAGAPVVDGERLIALVGGAEAKVVAFDKRTGKELWKSVPPDGEPGYVQPFLTEAGGKRQLVMWHPQAVTSLDPATGKIYWEQPFRIHMNLPVATPVRSGPLLLVSSFYNGSMVVELDSGRPAARLLWQGKSSSEIQTDGLHALVTTPVIDGDYIYGICSYGQLRCLNLKTGERVWESLEATRERARWASGFLVRHGDRYFINNDRGELIIARLSPSGYQEISRTKLIDPTSKCGGRRELGAVNWSHPAYANRHIFARNDEEILRASLEAANGRR